MDKIGIALIGAGKAGKLFASAFASSPRVRLSAIVAATEDEARSAGEPFDVPRCTCDYDGVLTDPRVNAVVIATPTHLHADQVVAAAKAGKHVLCDKPLCLKLADADRMINACRDAGVMLMLGFTERFNTAYRTIRQDIRDGKIGRVMMITGYRAHPPREGSWIMDDARSGGALLHTGCHNIDLVQWLLDARVVRVQAEIASLREGSDGKFSDCASVLLKLDNGAIATLVESYAYPKTMPMSVDRGLSIVGTSGAIYLDMMRQPVTLLNEQGWKYRDVLTWVDLEGYMGGAIREEVSYFVRCAATGREPTLSSGADGRSTVEVAEAAVQSAATKRAIDLPLTA